MLQFRSLVTGGRGQQVGEVIIYRGSAYDKKGIQDIINRGK